MRQKREQMWWATACVVGLLVAAWAAGGFIGPLMAVFIVLFMAGAVLVEFDGRDRAPMEDVPSPEDTPAPQPEPKPESAVEVVEAAESDPHAADAGAPDGDDGDSAEADLREAANSLA